MKTGEAGKSRTSRRPYGTGSVYRDKGSKLWSIQYSQNGRRVRESTGCKNKGDAQKCLTAQLYKINEGKTPEPLRPRHPVTVEKLYRNLETDTEQYRPWALRALRKNWRHLAPTFAS